MSSNWDYVNAINLDLRLKAPYKALMHALVSFRNNVTGRCNPSLDSLADRSGMTSREVIRKLKDLREGEFIAYTSLRNISNQYELYPTPDRFNDVGHAKHKVDVVADVEQYCPEASHFDLEYFSRKELDHPEWNDAFMNMQEDDINDYCVREFGLTLEELNNCGSRPSDLDKCPF